MNKVPRDRVRDNGGLVVVSFSGFSIGHFVAAALVSFQQPPEGGGVSTPIPGHDRTTRLPPAADDTLYTHGQHQPTHYGNDTCASIRINILMDVREGEWLGVRERHRRWAPGAGAAVGRQEQKGDGEEWGEKLWKGGSEMRGGR
ncbi:hypothetical protein KM043_009668 [Ampulex compressa]|nr:hypothetical protein KM043_009668 [Ampulex compressa]